MDPHDALVDVLIEELSNYINEEVLKKALSKKTIRKKLYKKIAQEMLYIVLEQGKLNLPPGFGSVVKKRIREKEKKIFNKSTGLMEQVRVSGNKLVFRPGVTIKQLL